MGDIGLALVVQIYLGGDTMRFFKVLSQTKLSTVSFSEEYASSEVIVGGSKYSFGVEYSPNEYRRILADDTVFNLFIRLSVKQLLMNNWKFINLIESSSDLRLRLITCELVDGNIDDFLEYENLNPDSISRVLTEYDVRVSKLFFRTSDQYMVIVMNNGVIGLDEELLSSEYETIAQLLDFLSYGRQALYEK